MSDPAANNQALSSGGPSDLRIEQTARAAERSRAGVWSLAHLRWCALTLLVAEGVLAIAAAVAAGAGAVVGVGIGAVIVGAFFTASTLVVAWVGRRNPKALMMTAVITYAVKVVALGVVLTVMPRDGFVQTRWMAAAVALGVIAWLAAHLRYVWTAKIFYVDPS